MSVVFFDEFDAWESFASCVKYTGDKEYCAKAVELLVEVQTRRVYDYGSRVRLRAFLPQHVRRFAMATDKERRAAVIFIDVIGATAVLFYERNDSEFKLKFVDWITTELKTLRNPPRGQEVQQVNISDLEAWIVTVL
jgi:hypothetical protein